MSLVVGVLVVLAVVVAVCLTGVQVRFRWCLVLAVGSSLVVVGGTVVIGGSAGGTFW